ncbi:HDIG domain-containing metalloprotein [candidate division KSB1 bacterium]
MQSGITYEQARKLFDKYVKSPVMRNHCRSSEVVMRALAKHLEEDEELWGIAGLLHDIDYELTQGDTKQHGILCQEILGEAGMSQELIDVIVAHVYGAEGGHYWDRIRMTEFEHALAASETVTGLIYAYGLMRPDKKLANAEVKSIKKKFKDKSFAAKVDRGVILECDNLGLELNEFLKLSLDAMKEIADEIGL